MFILSTASEPPSYYTGRAGAKNWLSLDMEEAFIYSGKGEADRKAVNLNRYTPLHGLTFNVLDVGKHYEAYKKD